MAQGVERGRVSRFLFVGQLAASSGFAVYSALIGDAVFVATNVATGLAAIAGAALTVILRRRAREGPWRARDGAAVDHVVRSTRRARAM